MRAWAAAVNGRGALGEVGGRVVAPRRRHLVAAWATERATTVSGWSMASPRWCARSTGSSTAAANRWWIARRLAGLAAS